MKSVLRTNTFLEVVLVAGLVALVAGGAVAAAVVAPHTTPSTAHGESFEVKPVVDVSFCINVPYGGTQGRPLTLSACGPAPTERWTFTKNSDGTNLFVDYQGMCVDAAGRKAGDGIALKVRSCSFVASQRSRFSSVGRIQISGTKMCLSIPRANSGAAVFLQTCDSSNSLQEFKLGQ
jgi:hypothetical protein